MRWDVGSGQVEFPMEARRPRGAVLGLLQILMCKGLAKETCCFPQHLNCQQGHVAVMSMQTDTLQAICARHGLEFWRVSGSALGLSCC